MRPPRGSFSDSCRGIAAAIVAAAAIAGVAAPACAQSVLPSGGQVAAGNVTIGAPAGNALSMTQTSTRAVVNWNSFSIGQPNTVTIAQPNSSAAMLNRVTGAAPSTLAGQLSANGQVYLVNPNGIAITKTGAVSVGGGFVASTLGIADNDFMAGNLAFAGGGASAPVTNGGAITTGSGGFAALVGGTVTNTGVVRVPLGKVALGSGERATLDLNGDGFMQIAVPTGAQTAQGQALVTNSGQIVAPGGTVLMNAATVATAIRDAVNMSGVVTANSVSGHNGNIELGGGPGGSVEVNGRLDVSAPAAGTVAGGAVTVSGAQVGLGGSAVIDARGARGGTVLVGVTAPGGVGKAAQTTIAPGAQILAGGNPAVSGSGGHIETSGDSVNVAGATINAGNGGTWLLDPADLTIDPTLAATINASLAAGTSVTEQTSAGGTGGTGNINVNSVLSWTTAATLTLSAYNGINVNSMISVGGGGTLVLTTDNANANPGAAVNFAMGQGSVQFSSAASAPQLFINNGPPSGGNGTQYTLLYSLGDLATMSGSSGNFALAAPLDAATAGTLGNAPVGIFSGIFNGLGNTIANLTINTSAVTAGLFASVDAGGVVANIGSVGGSVSDSALVPNVGGLVGRNAGTVSNAYATGAVNAPNAGTSSGVGGLVGWNDTGGLVTGAYATGAVSSVSSDSNVGGLVGYNVGTITNAYATGAVSGGGGNSWVGGLVGANVAGATIANSYATGPVAGNPGAAVGGFVGNSFGTITNSYWDTTTSGTQTGAGINTGSGAPTGLATAALSAALPSGFDASVWGNVGNLTTPYLLANPGPVYAAADPTPIAYNLVFTPAQLAAINGNPSGNFALAQDIDLTGVAFGPIGESTPFTGTFNGLGNVLTNLKIIDGSDRFVGLFGQIGAGGVVENIGLIGGQIASTQQFGATNDVGPLAGSNSGTISNAYATTPASAVSFGGTSLGGLVGVNTATGAITDAYATGSLTGNSSVGGQTTGGLVGTNNGAISDAYATGAVGPIPNGTIIGGLVGFNNGTITNAYAAGPVGGDAGFAGGLVGWNAFPGTITNGYWNADRAGTGNVGVASNSGTGAPTGLTGSAPFVAFSYSGFGFTSTPGASGNAWVMVEPDGSLAAGDSLTAAGAMPMLASEYSTVIQNAHQLQLMAMDLGANYTLGRSIDLSAIGSSTGNATGTDVWGCATASCTSSFVPVGNGSVAPYSGTFNGAGNTIANLLVDIGNTPDGQYAGLFGQLTGTVENVGLLGGAVSDGFNTNGSAAGSLVGQSVGTVRNVFASTAVSGGDSTGGLVGWNAGGSITDAYATGIVSGTNIVGGLVGQNSGPITDAYATGWVNGSGILGGLVGLNAATITDGYYDAGTTGQPLGAQANGSIGMTTASLQAGLPAFVDPGNWGIVAGLSYPYLAFQFPSGTPQVVSGTVYAGGNAGSATAGGGLDVFALINGRALDSAQTAGGVATGANGYYYFLLPPGAIPTAGNVLTYTSGAVTGAALADQVTTGDATNTAIYADTLHVVTSATAYSTVTSDLATAIGGNVAAGTVVGGLANLTIDAANDFAIDTTVFYPSGAVALNSQGGISETAGGAIDPGSLVVTAVGPVSMTGANTVDTLAFSIAGAGNGFAFRDDSTDLLIGTVGGVTGGTTNDGQIELSTTTGGNITIGQALASNGAEISLAAAPGSGIVNGAAIASGANIVLLGDAISLSGGTVSTGSASTGTVVLGPSTTSASITLGGAAKGTMSLLPADLATITAGTLQVGYRAADGAPSLTGDINIGAPLTLSTGNFSTLSLVTGGAGTITQGAGDTITFAGALGIVAGGAVSLTEANAVGTLAAYVDGAGSGFAFTNSGALGVGALGSRQLGVTVDATTGIAGLATMAGVTNPLNGIVTASGDVVLTTVAGPLTLAANVCAGSLACAATAGNTVALAAGGAIGQPGGVIAATTLRGSSVGGADFAQTNNVANFGPFTDTGATSTGLTLVDGTGLTIAGALSTPGPLTLSAAGEPALAISSAIGGTTVTLLAAGNIIETATGSIDATQGLVATTLLDTGGAITLDQPGANSVAGNVTLSSLNTAGTAVAGGAISFNDKLGFAVAGNGGLQTGVTTGGAVTLVSGGRLSETGVITADSLSGTSVGGAILDGANTVSRFGGFSDTGNASSGISFTNSTTLATAGTISSASGPISLTASAGDLLLSGDVTAAGNTVTLSSSGTLLQFSGVITAATLTGGSVGGAVIDGGNLVGSFGGFSDTGLQSSGISFTDAQAFATTGTISSLGGPIGLTTLVGDLTLGGDVTAIGNTVSLISAGAIAQSSGVITASLLTGRSVGGTSLPRGNQVDRFGGFTDSGTASSGIGFTDNQSFATGGTISSTGNVTLVSSLAGGTLTVDLGSAISAPGQTITLRQDQLSLLGTVDAGGGGVVIVPQTAGQPIDVGGPGGSGTLGVPNADFGQITASNLSIGNAAAGPLTVGSAIAPAGVANLTLSAGGDIALDGAVAISQVLTLDAGGTISQMVGAPIAAATLVGSSVGGADFGASANRVTTFGGFVDTGQASSGLSFTNAQTFATAGTISSATGPISLATTTGDLILGGNLTAAGNMISLNSAGAITQSSGAIDPGSLLIRSVGPVMLTGANTIDQLAAQITGAGASLSFNDTGTNLAVDVVGGVSGIMTNNGAVSLSTTIAGNIALNQPIAAGTGSVTLFANGTIGQSAAGVITGGSLTAVTALDGGGMITLNGANAIPGNVTLASLDGGLDGTDAGAISFNDTSGFTVAAATVATAAPAGANPALEPGISTSGAVTAITAGDLTIAAGARVVANSIALSAFGNFANNSGAAAVATPPGNRWLIYSNNPAGDSFGGLDSGNTAVWNATFAGLPPASVAEPGNRYLFAVQPTLVLTTTDLGKTYGVDATAAVASAYSIGGVQTGVAGAFLGDSLASVISGTPSVTSLGASATAGVAGSPYAITAMAGTFAAADGYAVSFANSGGLTVTPAGLTITAANQSKTYGQSLALGTTAFTAVGLVNGDTVAGVDLASAGAASGAAVAGSPYPIVASGPVGTGLGNYTLSFVDGGLTVTPAILTAGLTGSVGKSYDGTIAATNLAAANYTLSGVIGGDSVVLNDPTSGTYASPNAGNGIPVRVSGLALSGSAAGNYVLSGSSIVGSIGTISPAALTIAADDLTRAFGAGNPPLTFTVTAGRLLNGDTLSGALTTDATPTSAAGPYPIAEGSLTASANYRISFVDGVLTVLPPATPVTPPNIPSLATLAVLVQPAEAAASLGETKPGSPEEIALTAIAMFHASACDASRAPPALFVVLPSATGHEIGGVTVSNGTSQATLDQSFAAAELQGGTLSPCRVSQAAVDTTFRQAIAARPLLPHGFRLYFMPDSDRLTPELLVEYRAALADIAQRRTYQVEVIGHTDAVGSLADDRRASLSQAAALRLLLAHDRIEPGRIAIAGRGKLDLLIPTADQVAEPRNRRVEIWVR